MTPLLVLEAGVSTYQNVRRLLIMGPLLTTGGLMPSYLSSKTTRERLELRFIITSSDEIINQHKR